MFFVPYDLLAYEKMECHTNTRYLLRRVASISRRRCMIEGLTLAHHRPWAATVRSVPCDALVSPLCSLLYPWMSCSVSCPLTANYRRARTKSLTAAPFPFLLSVTSFQLFTLTVIIVTFMLIL